MANSKQKKTSLWRSCLTHLVAMCLGAFIFVGRQPLQSSSQLSMTPPSSFMRRAPENNTTNEPNYETTSMLAMWKNNVKTSPTRPYKVLPMMVLEHAIAPKDLRIIITEAQTRIQFNFTQGIEDINSIVGPFIIYWPSERDYVGKHIEQHTSDLNPRPLSIAIPGQTRKDVLYNADLWTDLISRTEKVLCLDISSVMCGNPTLPVSWFVMEGNVDWIGAAWSWASDASTSRHHRGGNGALSLRSPQYMLQILQDTPSEEIKSAGNEDMWFVSKLRDWEDSGEIRNGFLPPKLPTFEMQRLFAVETVASPSDHVPVGVYHQMITMSFSERQRLVDSCPEIKRHFPSLHEKTCQVMTCPKNMTLNYFEWETRQKDKDYNHCQETCNITLHPVAQAAKNWTSVI